LARFLRALGLGADQIPDALDERAALYRTVVSGRRMLVLLDNAGDPAQVRPLLPGTSTCAVIVTSRSRLAGLVARDGARRIVLDVMSRGDALRLLRRAVGDERALGEPGATAALADQCGYLPLALRIAAERIAADRETTIAAAVADLADRRTRLDRLAAEDDAATGVGAVLGWSYDRLPVPARNMFRLLGLAGGAEISVPAAAALAGVTPRQATARLTALCEAHLLEAISPGRYRMHDLLRLLAHERAITHDGTDERHGALRRLLGWYLHSAVAARMALDPHLPPMRPVPIDAGTPPATFTDQAAALDWFEAEQANLVAASRTAAELGMHAIAWQLPTALYGYFDLRKQYSDWIATHETAVASTRYLGDREAEGRILCNLGNAYRPLSRLAEAGDCYRRALERFGEVGYRQGQAKVLGNLSSTYQAQEQLTEALLTGEQAIGIFRELGDTYGEALALTNLGNTLRRLGRFQDAAEHSRDSLRLFEAIEDLPGQARALGNLGTAESRLGRPARGIDLIHRSIAIFEAVGDRYEVANQLVDLAEAYRGLGQETKADQYLKQALAYFHEVGDRHKIDNVEALRPTSTRGG
jgi:tetratricopeptide (TPR) repeat protein